MDIHTWDQLLGTWKDCADRAAGAIADRDFRAFSRAMRDGGRAFAAIQKLLRQDPRGAAAYRSRALAVQACWQELRPAIGAWQGNVRTEIDDVRRRRRQGRRVAKGYGRQSGTSGRNVRLRAR